MSNTTMHPTHPASPPHDKHLTYIALELARKAEKVVCVCVCGTSTDVTKRSSLRHHGLRPTIQTSRNFDWSTTKSIHDKPTGCIDQAIKNKDIKYITGNRYLPFLLVPPDVSTVVEAAVHTTRLDKTVNVDIQ